MKDTIRIDLPYTDVARVTLNRPDTGNAYDDELVATLITALDELAEDRDLKALWLTGAGEHFCKGPDAAWQAQRNRSGRAEHQQDAEQLARLFHTIYQFPTPTVATVRGQTFAAAVGVLCCCDIVYASERSSFAITETLYGQVPALQSPYLIKTIGERNARYYALSSEVMDAYTAARLGLVNKVVPANELEAIADILFHRMLKRSSMALKQTKAMIGLASNEVFDESLVETLIDCSTDIRISLTQETQKEPV